MELQELRNYAKNCINNRPELRDEIVGLWELCLNEIQEGGSRQHEIDLCHRDIEELMEKDC